MSRKVLFVTSNRIGDCVISSGIIREIARQVPGAQITVACGRPPATPALEAAGPRGIDCVGKGDILCSAAAIDRAALFVGNDSGLMHVAAAAGKPTLGLFGPTEWWLYGPRGPRTAIAASNPNRGQFAPIEALTTQRVFEAVLALHDTWIDASDPATP